MFGSLVQYFGRSVYFSGHSYTSVSVFPVANTTGVSEDECHPWYGGKAVRQKEVLQGFLKLELMCSLSPLGLWHSCSWQHLTPCSTATRAVICLVPEGGSCAGSSWGRIHSTAYRDRPGHCHDVQDQYYF